MTILLTSGDAVDALWVYLLPLLAAYLADAHWGRFKTIMVACAAAIAGHVILVICSVPVILTAPKVSLALLLIAIIVMVRFASVSGDCCC